ncbi:MAG: hypothetical protein SF051_00075 [Elusimicrobiota bacterium]|nr:hypothetical protein [Elusimicrobiota bacterium]
MRYWVYLKGEVPGSFEPEELAAMPGFAATTLVCPAEGEILEKNWRRAGEFEDLARCVAARDARQPEPPPASAAATPPTPGDVDALLDQTGARLFSHVAGLMKELEARREERALAGALQRQLAALKDELAATRDRAAKAEARLPRIPELEEALQRAQADLATLRDSLASRDAALEELRLTSEKTRYDLESARRKLNETANDLAIRNRLVDKLSKDLAEKELSLTKSLALIRRLEQDFHRLDGTRPDGAGSGEVVPLAEEPAAPSLPAAAQPQEATALPPAPKSVPPAGVFTQDEPPMVPPYLEPAPPEVSGAQEALSKFLRKVFPGQHS